MKRYGQSVMEQPNIEIKDTNQEGLRNSLQPKLVSSQIEPLKKVGDSRKMSVHNIYVSRDSKFNGPQSSEIDKKIRKSMGQQQIPLFNMDLDDMI